MESDLWHWRLPPCKRRSLYGSDRVRICAGQIKLILFPMPGERCRGRSSILRRNEGGGPSRKPDNCPPSLGVDLFLFVSFSGCVFLVCGVVVCVLSAFSGMLLPYQCRRGGLIERFQPSESFSLERFDRVGGIRRV